MYISDIVIGLAKRLIRSIRKIESDIEMVEAFVNIANPSSLYEPVPSLF